VEYALEGGGVEDGCSVGSPTESVVAEGVINDLRQKRDEDIDG